MKIELIGVLVCLLFLATIAVRVLLYRRMECATRRLARCADTETRARSESLLCTLQANGHDAE